MTTSSPTAVTEKLFHRVSGSGQTQSEIARVFEMLVRRLATTKPAFEIPRDTEALRITISTRTVTPVTVGPLGLHLPYSQLTHLTALFGGRAVFRVQPDTLLAVESRFVRLTP